MSFQAKVKIKEIQETQNIGQNGFRKRVLIAQTDEQYSQDYPLEFQHDSVDLLNGYVPNETVIVSFSIRCKGYAKNPEDEKKYYPTLVAYKIERCQ